MTNPAKRPRSRKPDPAYPNWPWLSLDEAMQYTGFDRDTLCRLLRHRGLPAKRINRRLLDRQLPKWLAHNPTHQGHHVRFERHWTQVKPRKRHSPSVPS